MTAAAEKVFDDALKLADGERRMLALWLLDSAGDELPEDVEKAWVEEARRRLADVRTGRTSAVPWEEAQRRIVARPR